MSKTEKKFKIPMECELEVQASRHADGKLVIYNSLVRANVCFISGKHRSSYTVRIDGDGQVNSPEFPFPANVLSLIRDHLGAEAQEAIRKDAENRLKQQTSSEKTKVINRYKRLREKVSDLEDHPAVQSLLEKEEKSEARARR